MVSDEMNQAVKDTLYPEALRIAARNLDLFKDGFAASTYLAKVFGLDKEKTMQDIANMRR